MKGKAIVGGIAIALFLGVLLVGCGEETANPVVGEANDIAEGAVVQSSGFEVSEIAIELNQSQSRVQAAPWFSPWFRVRLNVDFLPQVPPGDWSNTKNCGQAAMANCVGHLMSACMSPMTITYENRWLAARYRDNRYLSPNGWTTNVSKLEDLARNYWGFRRSKASRSSLYGVYRELLANRPVIVAVRIRMNTSRRAVGHFMVLVGMDKNYVWVNDVGRTYGKDNRYSLSQFAKSWATQNNSCVFVR